MDDAAWLTGPSREGRATSWLAGSLLVAAAALLLRQPLLVLLALAVALVLAVALLWRRYGLREVGYRRAFSQSHAFPGDEVLLEIVVENRKLLPLPWLEVVDEFPDALEYPEVDLEPAPKPRVGVFRALVGLGPYERVRRRYRVRCGARGYHRFGPARLKTGDVFGLATRAETVDVVDALIVYPRLAPVTAFGLPARQPLGDERPRRPLLEDPLRISGVRPYAPGDTPRRVHWRATARTGTLQAKQYEPSALPTLALFLDVNTFEHFWEGVDPERLERAISATASLAAHGLEERRQVGLFVNAPLVGGERFVRLLPSRHPAQLGRILEALALLVPYTGYRVEALVSDEARRLPWGATIVVVTAAVTVALVETLAALQRAGHAVVLITFGPPADLPSRPGFTVYSLGEEPSGAPLAALELA